MNERKCKRKRNIKNKYTKLQFSITAQQLSVAMSDP